MMNILIPMAGAGKRFADVGYTFPKPLIEVHGKPMIQKVVENIPFKGRVIFVAQKEHYDQYALKYLLPLVSPGCEIVLTEGLTEGAVCTTLLAEKYIDNDAPLVITNSDQYIEFMDYDYLQHLEADDVDAIILYFYGTHPKWSFIKMKPGTMEVEETAEKKPISTDACCGVFIWKRGSDYVKYAKRMIEKDIRTNGEFYVCPVFNEAIADGKRIIGLPINKMWGLGTPEDLRFYLSEFKR